MSEHHITAGFLPLMDSLILVITREKGFATAQGIDLTLVRETSWANVRDRIAVGHFDIAHMLGPMPVAACLGLTPIPARVIAPFSVGLGGNAITVSTTLWDQMADAGAPNDLDAGLVGAALAKIVKTTDRRIRFSVVHPHSAQNYELRYWLAASGIDPDRDIDIVVVPPPLMTAALKAGGIDGHCVGEPWGSASVDAGIGHIATIKAKIWKASPEKVIGTTEKWAGDNPEALAALLRALYAAARWCGEPANLAEAASILASPLYLDLPEAITIRGLSGQIETVKGSPVQVDDFFTPFAGGANIPRREHALWFYSQMARWGDLRHTRENAELAANCYRPDLLFAAVPEARAHESSQPLTLFDGGVFAPGTFES